MAQPPLHIAQYLGRRFPRPRVDPEWLLGCYEWLIGQPSANDSSQKFLTDVELQLLQSDLRDSMIGGTGLPENATQSDHPQANTRLAGSPILVEIAAMTEIAHSAYQLDQIRVAREERMRLGQTDEDGEDEGDLEVEGEGPMPKYPRGMLKFELSDGTTTLSAIEYRPLPEIVLGKTPLGFKMLLKNPLIRHGIAFLEPDTVELLGHQTVDRETLQSSDFRRGLRVRMGLPDQPEIDPEPQTPQVAVAPPVRSPLREISPPPNPSLNPTYNDDENLEPRRRKLPSTNTTVVPTQTSPVPPTPATLIASRNSTITSQYFANSGSSPATVSTGFHGLNLSLTTAQSSQGPARNDNDDEEEAMFSYFDSAVFLEAPDTLGPDENAPPLLPFPGATQPLNSKSPPSRPFPMTLTSSSIRSSARSQKVTPTTRALAPEDSIEIIPSGPSQKMTPATRSLVSEPSVEIVSFTSSQAPVRSQPQTQSRGKGKGKEKANSNDRQSSTGPVIDVSGDLDFDPLFFKDLDEVEALRYADPDFQRRQQEELDRFSRTGSSTSPIAHAAASASTSNGTERGQIRLIKPLPKPRLQQSSQGSSQPPSSQSKEVIEIGSDSSNSSSPRVARTKPLPRVTGSRDDDDIGFFDGNEDLDEEQYDKENMPVMTRHVRRKVANSRDTTLSGGIFGNGSKKGGGGSGDVIDLSD